MSRRRVSVRRRSLVTIFCTRFFCRSVLNPEKDYAHGWRGRESRHLHAILKELRFGTIKIFAYCKAANCQQFRDLYGQSLLAPVQFESAGSMCLESKAGRNTNKH